MIHLTPVKLLCFHAVSLATCNVVYPSPIQLYVSLEHPKRPKFLKIYPKSIPNSRNKDNKIT